ncbi:MAG: protease modulator HflC [Rhodospirillales bacterium]
MSGVRLGLVVLVVLLGVLGFSAIFTVYQTEQALILRFGEPRRVITEPGLNFKLPLFVESVVKFDRRILDYDVRAEEIPTSDQKQVVVDAFTRYRIVDPLRFFQTVTNERGMESRLDSVISSNLRAVFGKVNLAVVMTEKRAALMDTIFKRVKAEGVSFGINVIDVRMKRVDLPEENSQAIFRRMQTQREQVARRFRADGDRQARTIRADADRQVTVIKATAQKKAEILMGDGDAEAQRIYNEAYGQDWEFFNFWVSLNKLRDGLSGDTTSYVGAPGGGFIRFFDDLVRDAGKK